MPIAPQVLQSLIRAVRKPVVVAPLLGILCSLAGFDIGDVAKACLGLSGEITPGTALFLTGFVVSAQPFKLDWKVAAATAFGDVIRPLFALAVVLVLPVSSEVMKVAVLIAAVHSGFLGILFVVDYRLNSGVIASMVAASSLVSIITLPITIALLFPS